MNILEINIDHLQQNETELTFPFGRGRYSKRSYMIYYGHVIHITTLCSSYRKERDTCAPQVRIEFMEIEQKVVKANINLRNN